MQQLAPPSTLSGDGQEEQLADSALLGGPACPPSSGRAFLWVPSYFQPEPKEAPPAGRPPKASSAMAAVEEEEERWSATRLPRLSRKTWMIVSVLEFAVILILAAGLAHLVLTRGDEDEDEAEKGPWLRGRLASLHSMNETLRHATLLWEACENETSVLSANLSSLGTELTHLSERLRMKEFENRALEDKVTMLKNWTQQLQDLNTQQKELIQHFYQQQRKSSSSSSLHTTLALLALAVAGLLLL